MWCLYYSAFGGKEQLGINNEQLTMKKIIGFYIIIMQLAIATFTYSQNIKDDYLKRYIQIAEENNPELKGKFNEYKAELEKTTIAGALPDPNITFGYFLQSMELLEGNQVADIKLMQMFPWFGTLKASKNEASQMAKSKYEEMRDVKYRIVYDIQSQYYQLYQTDQTIKLSFKNIEILNTIKQLALVKFKTDNSDQQSVVNNHETSLSSPQSAGNMQGGMQSAAVKQQSEMNNQGSESMGGNSSNGGLAEILRIQLEINDIDNNIVLLKNNEKAMIARFNSYLNRKPTFVVRIADTLTADTTNDFRFTIDSILKNSPMLGMISSDMQANDANIRMSKLMRYPMLGLGVDYGVINKRADVMSGMNGKDMIMPMLSVSLPIYRRKYNAQIKETTLQKTANENKYDAAQNSLQADYIEELQKYNNGKQRLKFTKNQAAITQITFNLVINNFSSSKADMTEILRVQQQLLDYKLKSVEALVDIKNAQSSIKKLMATDY